MTTIIGMIALIFAIIGVSTGVLLTRVLEGGLDANVRDASQRLQIYPSETAADALANGHPTPGTLLVIVSAGGGVTGAYVGAGYQVQSLSADQLAGIVRSASLEESMVAGPPVTVPVPGLDAYRMVTGGNRDYVAAVGLPMSRVRGVISQLLVTVTVLTTIGLVILGLIIALVIRKSLRPLRTIADTAARVAAVPMESGTVAITERVPGTQIEKYPEVRQVGEALNTLLDHVDSSLSVRQRAEERMRAFVADASHELRTPLASIRGYSELSLRGLHHSPDHPDTAGNLVQSFERIQAQSLRMSSLVEDLLLLTRLDEGQELMLGPVDLTRTVLDAVGDATAAGPGHHWVFNSEDEPVLLYGDPARLEQVVVNLLANARTHTPAGTTVTVTVTVARVKNSARILVHDDGPGIDQATAAKIFDRFARADSSRARQTGGTGLGLAISRAIVEAHGGTLTVTSRPGDTTFTVSVPIEWPDPHNTEDV